MMRGLCSWKRAWLVLLRYNVPSSCSLDKFYYDNNQVLEDTGKIKSTSAILIIGMLVIEDLAAIVIISMLHSGVISGSFDFMQILMTICEIGLFIEAQ